MRADDLEPTTVRGGVPAPLIKQIYRSCIVNPALSRLVAFLLIISFAPSVSASELSIGTEKQEVAAILPYDCSPVIGTGAGTTYYCTSHLGYPDEQRQMGIENELPEEAGPMLSLQLDSRSQLQRIRDKTGSALGELSSIAKIRLNPDGSLDTLTLGSGAASIKLDGATLKNVQERGVIDPQSADVKLSLTIKIPGL